MWNSPLPAIDVKLSFASHLYRHLHDHGLNSFLDKEKMEGHKISSEKQELSMAPMYRLQFSLQLTRNLVGALMSFSWWKIRGYNFSIWKLIPTNYHI